MYLLHENIIVDVAHILSFELSLKRKKNTALDTEQYKPANDKGNENAV